MSETNHNLVDFETTSNTSSQNNSPRLSSAQKTLSLSATGTQKSPAADRLSARLMTPREPIISTTSDATLVAKTEQLAQELSQLQDLTNQLRAERHNLETLIKQKDDSLIATTVELETESDTLSNARRELREKRNETLILQRKNLTMDGMSALHRLTAERQNMRESRDRTNVTMLDDDSMQKIIDLSNEKRLRMQHIEDLKHEIATLQEIVDKKVNAVESLDKQIKEYQWKEDRAYELECTNNELMYQVENLQKEIKTLEQITRMKTQTIEKLNHQVGQWKELEEDHRATQKIFDYKQTELDMLNADLERVQRENTEKEEEIERILNSRDLVPIRTLESDKVFLKTEMKKKQDQKSTLEKTIKWQEKQIQMLQGRLHALNFALKETKVLRFLKKDTPRRKEERPDSDQVPIHLYLLMVYDLQTIEKRAKNLELLLDEKNIIAESLESKLEDYEQQKLEEAKSFKREAQDLRRQIEEIQQQIRQSEELYKSEENLMKAKNISIKKKLFATQPRPTSSPREANCHSHLFTGCLVQAHTHPAHNTHPPSHTPQTTSSASTIMSFDLSNTKNTNVWREALNREFKSRRENKNPQLSIEEVSSRAKSLAQLHLQAKQEKQHAKQLKKSSEYDSLYYGLSHENTGRKAYLQRRHAKDPHERQAPTTRTSTSAQEVGHGVATYGKDQVQLPEHGHKCLIKKQFYSTKGVF